MFKKEKKSINDLTLCNGVYLDNGFFLQEDKRIYTLWIKGFIVYLMVMGGIGSYLTAIGSNFSALILHFVIFLTAMACSMLYFGKKSEIIGYLVLFVGIVFLAFQLRTYINSGFYGVINDTLVKISDYFKLGATKNYGEQIANQYVSITISMSFIGVVLCIFLNVLISRRMQYVCAFLCSALLLGIPLYLETEPNLLYSIMLMGGTLLAYLFRSSKKYKIQTDNKKYVLDKKYNLSYGINTKVFLYLSIGSLLLISGVILLVGVFVPKETFRLHYGVSENKKESMEMMARVLNGDLSAIWGEASKPGGLDRGKLGDVDSVTLSYRPNLLVRFTPYTTERMYLRSFYGSEYMPYENNWSSSPLVEGSQNLEQEVSIRKESYDNQDSYSALGQMIITNVGAVPTEYVPYYAINDQGILGFQETKTYRYYPFLSDNLIDLSQERPSEEVLSLYKTIPFENKKVIEDFCKQAAFSGEIEDILVQVTNYFQEHMPYTLSPGATPRNQDFINYFLMENKKGYCAHYASSATLIFRYLGIPARYVEGYALDYTSVLDGALVQGAKYEDYYSGYSLIGETGVVEVELKDADAHAWVEVYHPKLGWIPVEVTPFATDDEEPQESFWSTFLNFLGGDTNIEEAEIIKQEPTGSSDIMIQNIGVVLIFILIFALLLVITILFVKTAFSYTRYHKLNRNDQLIYWYKKTIRKLEKKYPLLKESINYQQQIKYLVEVRVLALGEEETIIRILQQAGFSNEEIKKEEFKFLVGSLKTKKVKKETRLS